MKPRVIVNLFYVLVFILMAESAFGVTKIVPSNEFDMTDIRVGFSSIYDPKIVPYRLCR